MPFTTNKGLSVQATASNSGVWGSDGTTPTANSSNALNQGVTQLLDQILGGTTTLSLASTTPVALTQLQTQNGLIRITGTLTANIVVSPDSGVLWTGIYSWENVTSGSFSVTITNSAGSVALPQGRRGLLWIDTTTGPRILAIAGSGTADPIPAASKMLFYNASAPSGWTAVALNDYGVKIVTNGSGAVASGSVAYSTLFARTATDSHTLTTAQLPAHTHTAGSAVTAPAGSDNTLRNTGAGDVATGSTGGGDGHTHNIDMRVNTAAFVLATRD